MQGIIALDIDGTITVEHHELSRAVAGYLSELASREWLIVFITGRTFNWGFRVLKDLPFRYFLAVQNGAIILEMPMRFIISRKYLDRSILFAMDKVCQGEPSDYVVYAGYEHHDVCFYRPKKFSSELLRYLEKRVAAFHETWQPLNSFDEMPLESFASVKCFGREASALRLAQKIEEKLGLHVPLIRDPFDKNYLVVQATYTGISKGQALKDLMAMEACAGTVIAAGDDRNDISMLEMAHIKVVMSTAPKEMLDMADVVAPPAGEEGIIAGLQAALKLAL